jgi:hypothetical protein
MADQQTRALRAIDDAMAQTTSANAATVIACEALVYTGLAVAEAIDKLREALDVGTEKEMVAVYEKSAPYSSVRPYSKS